MYLRAWHSRGQRETCMRGTWEQAPRTRVRALPGHLLCGRSHSGPRCRMGMRNPLLGCVTVRVKSTERDSNAPVQTVLCHCLFGAVRPRSFRSLPPSVPTLLTRCPLPAARMASSPGPRPPVAGGQALGHAGQRLVGTREKLPSSILEAVCTNPGLN